MNAPDSVIRIVRAARRRLLAAGMTARVVGWVGVAAALAAGLAAVARIWVIAWADAAVVAAVALAALAAVVWSLIRRPTVQGAAIEVDRRLGGYDRVTTALELGERAEPDPVEQRQLDAASAWADSRDVREVAELVPSRPAVGLTLLAVAVLAALVLVPAPTDVALAERQADQQAIEEEAERLRDLATELPDEVAADVEDVADRLQQAVDLEAALDVLGEARQELAEALDPAALSKQTGLAGLETSFDQDPVGEGDSAAEQLEDLADRLEQGDTSGLPAAVSQLEQRAADAAGVNPELSQALQEAAEALAEVGEGGDPGEAAEAVREAADAIERAHAEARANQGTARAAGEVADAQRRLADRQGQAQGHGEGQGQGQGQGGGGGGNGSGGQQGAGSGSGSSGGMNGGNPGGQGDDDPDVAPGRGNIFEPPGEALGDREQVDLAPGDEQGEVQGLTDGRGGVQNLPLVPYTDRLGDYRDTALESLDSLVVPASVRDVVRDYFTQLQP